MLIKKLLSFFNKGSLSSKSDKIVIVFLVEEIHTFSMYYGIFLAAQNREDIVPYVLLMDYVSPHVAQTHETKIETTELRLKEQYGIDAIKASKINALKELRPDFVFLPNAYEDERPAEFAIRKLKAFTKVCVASYGMFMTNRAIEHYSIEFFQYCWRIFIDSPMLLESCKKYLSSDLYCKLEKKMVVSGLSKIEVMRDWIQLRPDNEIWKLSRDANVKRIIWLPHHSLTWVDGLGDNAVKLGFSTFMKYYNYFLNLARRNSRIEIVLRPHPILFTAIEKSGLMTKEELEAFKNSLNSLPNASINESFNDSYMDLFVSSDAMIGDGVSLLPEYAVTGKPILHTMHTEKNRASFNEYGELLVKDFYKAYSENDIENFVYNILGKNNDYMRDQRMESLRSALYEPVDGCGHFIINNLMKK